jgi:predicted Zn-dependent protease
VTGLRVSLRTRLKKWQGVIEDCNLMLKDARKLTFTEIPYIESRANAYLQLGQYDRAIADYKLGTKNFPDKRQCWQGLVIAYTKAGRIKEAAAAKASLASLDDDMRPMR